MRRSPQTRPRGGGVGSGRRDHLCFVYVFSKKWIGKKGLPAGPCYPRPLAPLPAGAAQLTPPAVAAVQVGPAAGVPRKAFLTAPSTVRTKPRYSLQICYSLFLGFSFR